MLKLRYVCVRRAPPQNCELYGRGSPGEKPKSGNALAVMASGGGGGQSWGGGNTEDITSLDRLICRRAWDHEEVRQIIVVIIVMMFLCGHYF